MIFKFLRQFLKDDEFEHTKIELAETKIVLKDYKEFIEAQKVGAKEENENVEPDFLVLLWAAVGLSLTLAVEVANELPKSEDSIPMSTLTFDQGVWLVLTLVTGIFLIINTLFAIELTVRYAQSKTNRGYKVFAYSLIYGLALFVLGIILIAIF